MSNVNDADKVLDEIPNIAFAVNILGQNTESESVRVVSFFDNNSRTFEWKHIYKIPSVFLDEYTKINYIAFLNLVRVKVSVNISKSDDIQLKRLAEFNASIEMIGIFKNEVNETFAIIHNIVDNNSVLKYCFWNEVYICVKLLN